MINNVWNSAYITVTVNHRPIISLDYIKSSNPPTKSMIEFNKRVQKIHPEVLSPDELRQFYVKHEEALDAIYQQCVQENEEGKITLRKTTLLWKTYLRKKGLL